MTSEMDQQDDTYLVGYGDAAQAWISHRTAESHAAFFTPHLKSGMTLLDCGCGPGGITVGLAAKVAPGAVTAIDIESAQLAKATQRAADEGLTNITFEEANLFDLPYDDNSFDAIYMSAVLSNLQRPHDAMAEVYRVLKPGGVAGFNEFDSGGDIYYPMLPGIQRSTELYFKLREHVGDDPRGGRRLKALLHQAGFQCDLMQAIYEIIEPAHYAHAASVQFEQDLGPTLIDLGLTTEKEIQHMSADWAKFAKHPDAFVGAAWVQALGRKS